MSEQEIRTVIETLRAENEALREKKAAAGKLSLKVSDKGGVSVYGLGRFPVTLYREQWARLIAHIGEVKDFIKANEGELAVKVREQAKPEPVKEQVTRSVPVVSGAVSGAVKPDALFLNSF